MAQDARLDGRGRGAQVWNPTDPNRASQPSRACNVAIGVGVGVRLRKEATVSIPQRTSVSNVLASPAPTVWAACESVPVVISVPPRSAYQRTIAGPGMLVFGDCRSPDVLISNATPR